MTQTRLVVTIVTFYKNECPCLFPRLEEFRKRTIDVGWPETGRKEGSAISLELLECKLRWIGGSKACGRLRTTKMGEQEPDLPLSG